MIFIEEDEDFPSYANATKEGLLCVSENLSQRHLLLAYKQGIFPWADNPVLWFNPPERCIMPLDNFHISKSLLRDLKKNDFTLKCDSSFKQVIGQCMQQRKDTWISQEFIEQYTLLHKKGYAHSIEVWQDNSLIGGLYGISLGSAFFGESMFHLKKNASKIAFCYLSLLLQELNFSLLDCQVENNHLLSLGAEIILRKEYLSLLNQALTKESLISNWSKYNHLFNKIYQQKFYSDK